MVKWEDVVNAPEVPSLPDWVTDPPQIITSPQAWLAGVVIGWILSLWESVLKFIDSMWSTLSDLPRLALYYPITSAFSKPGTAIQDMWRDVGDVAVDVSSVAGPFAPIVVVGIWAVGGLVAISFLYLLWGIIETYIPVSGIPFLRRLS